MVRHIERQSLREELLRDLRLAFHDRESLVVAGGHLLRQLVPESDLVALRALRDCNALSVFAQHEGRTFGQAQPNDALEFVVIEDGAVSGTECLGAAP